MFKRNKICVVVPAYKEEQRVAGVIKEIPEFIDHIIVVDDGSTDGTYQKVLENINGRVIAIKHLTNQGVGAAILTGHKKAMEIGAEISVVMAGDGQMDPKYLGALLSPIINEDYDYAKGNRFIKRQHTRGMPRIRVLGNIALSLLTKAASGYWKIFDSQNGYTAIKTSILKKLDLEHLDKRYQFENDMLIHLNLVNAKVKDVPIPASYNGEKSKINLIGFMSKTFFFLLQRFFYRVYKKHIFSN